MVACRPAATSVNQDELGPPVLMLVTYNNSYNSNQGHSSAGSSIKTLVSRRQDQGSRNRAVMYFHWSGLSRAQKKRRKRNQNDERDEVEAIRTLVEVLRIKDQWVNAIHQVFFPLRATLVSNTTR